MKTPAHSYVGTKSLGQDDVDALVTTLEQIEKQGGRLDTTEMAHALVKLSRPESSPTHHLFEWDDAKAAIAHRLDHARQLIREIRVVFDDKPDEPVRAFPVIVTGGKRGPYPMTRIVTSQDLMLAMIEQAKADAFTWTRRWDRLREVGELAGIFEAIETAKTGKPRKAKAS